MKQLISFNITIVSNTTDLEQRILSVSAEDGRNVSIRTCAISEAEYSDVLILDVEATQGELPVHAECLETILYATLDRVSPALLGDPHLTDFWPRPISDEMLGLLLRRLFLSVEIKKELSQTKTFLDTLINSIPDLVWFKDLRGSHMKVNDAFCRAVGKTEEQCRGRGHYYIWDLKPDEYATGEYVCLETEEEVIRRKETCLFDEKVKSKNGLRQFKTYKSPLVDERGELFGTVGIAKDVTDLQNISREMEVIFSGIPFAAMIVDEEDSVISCNPKFCEYFHIEPEAVQHMSYSDICSNILGTTQDRLENNRMTEVEYVFAEKQYIFHAQQQPIHDIFGNHFGIFFICLDVTNEYELQHRLLRSANTDFLTKLCNRRYFYEVIGEKTDMEQMSFVYFDMDNFKQVNDTYGHKSGDNALILMAECLQDAFAGQLIARLGGDEFVVAFFGPCILQKLAQDVQNFIERIGEVFRSTKHMEVLTVSAGIACNGSSKDVDALLSCADKALYAAKAQGKARYTVYRE